MKVDTAFTNARLATMDPALPGLGLIENAVLAVENDIITYVGPAAAAPAFAAIRTENMQGRWITPGLIDCHTHIVHGGDRAREFEMRLDDATYEDISRAGGGIMSTVRATRAATLEQLVESALPRLDALIAEGVTTIEIKSGYGLTVDSELKMLQAARALAARRSINIKTTFLGAHALPPEFADNRSGYLDLVCDLIPQLEALSLADAVDGFCEGIAFSPAEITRVFTVAQKCGLRVKLHADQLSNLEGAALAAHFKALSADHLEYTSEAGAAAMAKSGTVATILPGAFYTLRETTAPPIALFRKHAVPMAIATDCNPGTAPITSLLTTLNMAATLFRMTVEECLLGVTRNAARALASPAGVLSPGRPADIAIWNIERPAELVYRIGFNPLHRRIIAGAL